MRRAERTVGGFSLVELVAALAIFGVGAVAMLELTTACLRSADVTEDRTRAAFMAQGLMEETLADGLLIEGEESGEFGDEFPDASWTRSIEEDLDTSSLYQVTVTVSWADRDRERRFELTTLAAER